MDLLHLPPPLELSGLPTTDVTYRRLIGDLVEHIYHSMASHRLRDMERTLGSGEPGAPPPTVPVFRRRLAAHLIGQQWALLHPSVAQVERNNPGLAAAEVLASAAASADRRRRLLHEALEMDGSSSSGGSSFHRSRRRDNTRHARLLTKLSVEQQARVTAFLAQEEANAATAVAAATTLSTNPNPSAAATTARQNTSAVATRVEMRQWADQAASMTTPVQKRLESPDLLATRIVTSQPRVVADCLAQLLPTVIQALRPRSTKEGSASSASALNVDDMITLLAAFPTDRPETLALVMAALAHQYAQDGQLLTDSAAALPLGQSGSIERGQKVLGVDYDILPEHVCFLWLVHQGGDGAPPVLLDLGRFYTRLVRLCRAHLPHLPLLQSLLTWVMTALAARDDDGLERALWETAAATSAGTAATSLFERTATVFGPLSLSPERASVWFLQAWDNKVRAAAAVQDNVPTGRRFDLLEEISWQPSAARRDFWRHCDWHLYRLFHAAMDYHPLAYRSPYMRYITETYAPLRRGNPLGLAVITLETGAALAQHLWHHSRGRRLFIHLEYNMNTQPRPPMCWVPVL